MNIYVLTENWCWGHEDHGTEIIGCFEDLYHADLAAYYLRAALSPRDKHHIDYDVEELVII